MILSVISLPGTKVDCSSEIISGNTNFKGFEITLNAILSKTLHRLIRRNYDRRVGFFTLGIRTKADSLMHSTDIVPSTILNTTLVTSSHKPPSVAEESVQEIHPDQEPLLRTSKIGPPSLPSDYRVQ